MKLKLCEYNNGAIVIFYRPNKRNFLLQWSVYDRADSIVCKKRETAIKAFNTLVNFVTGEKPICLK